VGRFILQIEEEKAMSFLQKVESVVNLPVVLKIAGAVVLGLTAWKGVHGFFPTFGIVAGGLTILAGSMFSKIVK
jgi:hypothetical protein